VKRSIALGVMVAAVVLASNPASATKPVREFVPSEDAIVSDVCPFDLGITVLQDNVQVTTFFDQEGNVTRLHSAGKLIVELSNEETGESMVANISGPGTSTFTDDSEVLEAVGPWLFFFFPGDLGEGEPGMALLTTGRFVVEFSAVGVSILEQRGRVVDVCALLS
jgi:hypothetical protein